MASKPKLETRLAVIVVTDKGDRAAYTIPVRLDPVAAAERAERIRTRLAAETGCPVRVDAFTHTVAS